MNLDSFSSAGLRQVEHARFRPQLFNVDSLNLLGGRYRVRPFSYRMRA